jgi:hypothetical protein
MHYDSRPSFLYDSRLTRDLEERQNMDLLAPHERGQQADALAGTRTRF